MVVKAKLVFALCGLGLIVLALSACGGGEHHYSLAQVKDCFSGPGSIENFGLNDESNFTGDTTLAQVAYDTGQGAFSADDFPQSSGGGAVFYGFASSKTAQAAMAKYWGGDTTAQPGAAQKWRVGNILVEGVPTQLPSVEEHLLAKCFGGKITPVMPPPPSAAAAQKAAAARRVLDRARNDLEAFAASDSGFDSPAGLVAALRAQDPTLDFVGESYRGKVTATTVYVSVLQSGDVGEVSVGGMSADVDITTW